MATYVTGKFSEFIGRDGFPEHWKRCTFVVPSYDDIWWLKEVFADSNVEIGGIEFFTADEFREHLCTVFSIGKMICAGSLVDFYFDEMASRVSDRGVVGNAIVASRQATLQAFFKILASGVRFDDLCNEESRRIFEDFRSEVSQNGCIFANDADRSLLKLAEASPLKFDESVVFYGFLPFDGAKVLMETAAKCYSRADAVSHDFGDAEFIHLWIGTLEKIFGESIFSHCGGGEGSVEFNAYETSYDEVEMTFRSIQRILAENSSARVGLCFDGDGSPQISMLRDRMDAAGIRYHDAIGRYRNPQNYSTLIALWADWQIKREAGPFCKFCADLVANNLLPREQFDGIIGNVFSLRTRCLSENYDVLLEFANVKNIDSFDAVERYDIHGARFSFENFYEKFAIAFDTILPQNILDALRKQLEFPHWKRIFCRSSLVKYFAKFTTIGIKDYAIGSNVVLIELDSAFKQNFTHIFVPGMTARRFEIPEDGFLIGADDIDAINASAIVVSTYGDLAIRRSRNFILSARSKRYLQGTIFEFFAKCEKMTLSYALKDYSSVETRQFPAKVFAETFCARSGEFYSAELEKKLLVMGPPPARNLEAETEKNIEDCAASYAIRHDLSVSLHDYCFAIGGDADVKISCKAMENLLKNPHIGFYDHVLRLPVMPWRPHGDGKKLLIGSLVHEFLQIFEAGNKFTRKTSPEIFYENIKSRARRVRESVARACAAADAAVPPGFDISVATAATTAKLLVGALFATGDWKSFCSEYSIPRNLTVKIGDCRVKLSGRLDFLTSFGEAMDYGKVGNVPAHFPSDAVIIDFKTGGDSELTEKNVVWHLQKYDGVQLFLYGIALEAIGFERVKIMVLKPNSRPSNEAISMDYISARSAELVDNLARVIRSRLLERRVLGNFRQYFPDLLPLATTDLY